MSADDLAVQPPGTLAARPARAPDHAAENRALVELARHVATAPDDVDVLQQLVETARTLCRADSAGLSAVEEEGGRRVLRWHALAGPFARHRWTVRPLDESPSALAIEAREPVLIERPDRRFPFLAELSPPIAEALLVPFPLGATVVGTLWVASHDEQRRFDREDARLLDSLAHFASAAYRMVSTRHESQQLATALRRRELELRRLLEFLPVGACTCDENGRVTYVNREATRLWGGARAVGDRLEHGWMMRALREGRAYHGREIEIERPDGTRVAALAHASPVVDEQGARSGAIGIFVDISERKRAEEALHESEQRFARFMHHLPGLAWIKDLGGRYLFVNEAAERAFGRTREELYGRSDAELFPEATAEQFASNDRQVLDSGVGVEAIETLEHTDGTHHSLVSKFPIPGPDGKPALIGGVAIDITERLRAEEELRQSVRIYRAIGDSIDYGVWVCDPDGRNVYASESFLKLVGLSQEQCSDEGWAEALHPDEAEATLAAWRECARTGRQWDVEHRFRGADGRWHPVLARGVPVRDESGEIAAWAGINLDISRQKQVEEELRAADQRKDEFLATLAHELRNPLAPIRNSLSVLRLAGGGPGVERVYDMMERQVDQMVRLVDDLLEVSRISRGKLALRRERVELGAVLRAAVETSRPLLEASRHRLEIELSDEPIALDADPVRLAQVFSNLLNNAAKYTDAGGRITLRARRTGDAAVIAVRDDGVGIPTDRLGEVFDLFQQVDGSAGRAQGGLGIGLTLVRRLVELHGGRVEARSEGPGTGSEFVVTLPLAGEAERADAGGDAPAASPPERLHGPHRVLVVDDNVDAGESLELLLRVLGVEAQLVHDGEAALEALDGFEPAMVLLDLGMPGMDGYEVARRIRERRPEGRPLVIALTGWGQPEDRRRTREAGFDDHLVKPVGLGVLQSLLAVLDR
jgi:PAS domain S-box-containing protein